MVLIWTLPIQFMNTQVFWYEKKTKFTFFSLVINTICCIWLSLRRSQQITNGFFSVQRFFSIFHREKTKKKKKQFRDSIIFVPERFCSWMLKPSNKWQMVPYTAVRSFSISYCCILYLSNLTFTRCIRSAQTHRESSQIQPAKPVYQKNNFYFYEIFVVINF